MCSGLDTKLNVMSCTFKCSTKEHIGYESDKPDGKDQRIQVMLLNDHQFM